jgi:hypothetical protein
LLIAVGYATTAGMYSKLLIDGRQLLVVARGLYTTSRYDMETEAKMLPTAR